MLVFYEAYLPQKAKIRLHIIILRFCVLKNTPYVTELRFLRLSIQYAVPSILAYKENIEEDKAFILKYIEKEEAIIQTAFKTFCEKYDV